MIACVKGGVGVPIKVIFFKLFMTKGREGVPQNVTNVDNPGKGKNINIINFSF